MLRSLLLMTLFRDCGITAWVRQTRAVPAVAVMCGFDLTPEQKAENRMISLHRVISEHAIGGVGRLKSLRDVYRNRKEGFDDRLMNIGCGMWNHHLKADRPAG